MGVAQVRERTLGAPQVGSRQRLHGVGSCVSSLSSRQLSACCWVREKEQRIARLARKLLQNLENEDHMTAAVACNIELATTSPNFIHLGIMVPGF